ncbi:unnamed protein product [Symbiodinium sp. KB8]|nr:unnamed protein product [Symbiodinium sp. KB8]
MASTHDELMKTTGSLCKWLTEQKSTLDDKVFQEVLETQHKTVCEQIRAIGSITPEQATGFSNAFNTGPWSSAQKESITKLISNLMASPTTRRTRRENQDVQTFAHYFSRKDHEVLADESKSDHDKIDTIANRLVKLHLWLPSEQAVRAVMQAAVASGFTHAEEHRIGIVRAIKAAVKQRTKSMPRTLQLPTPMPSNPKDLPGDIFAQACPEGDPPVSLEEGKCLAVQMFARNSHSSSSGGGELAGIDARLDGETEQHEAGRHPPDRPGRFCHAAAQGERLLTAQRKCFVSQRALAEILSIVKDDDEENLATSRQAIKRKRERELQIDTPYGPVWRSMSGFVMEKGKPLTVSYLDPAALLWAVCRDGQGFAEFLVRRHELHPSGPSQPWSICLYMDEVSPGNQLKPSNDRKLQVIYMSLKQLGGLALSKEDSWLLVSCIRSVDVKRCANGMAQVMKRFLEVFLVERRDVLRMILQTDSGMMKAAKHLAEQHPVLNKGQFKTREMALGLNYVPHGVMQHEMNLLRVLLKQEGIEPEQMHSFFQGCEWPAYIGGRSVSGKNLFHKKDQEFKCSASEGLAFYPVMQSFLQRRLPGIASRECREAIQSFFLLCDVLDALQLCATGRVDADNLEEKLCRHLRKYVEVYGPDKVLPKGHYALHLADSLREHEILLSCFVHERRHRSVKQIADQLDSMKAGSEEHVMQVVVENHLKNLRTYSVGRKGLVTPRSAAAPLQQAFCHCFGLDECLGLESCNEAAVGQGRICKRGDVVVVTVDGTLTVAQVWLHVSFCGHAYTRLSEWANLGNNMFRMDSSRPIFVPTSDISALCVHRPEGDDALVIPLNGPL